MKTIVYTTIFGGSDSLKQAPSGCRAVCFTDVPLGDSRGWESWLVHQDDDPRRAAWYLRCVPHLQFREYDRVVWIDASFTLTDLPRLLKDAGDAPVSAIRHHARNSCYREGEQLVRNGQATKADIDRQLGAYTRAGFMPTDLSISCVIVRDRSAQAQAFNETWDQQIRDYPGDNTQVSLDYAAWVNGFSIKALKGSRHQNPYATHDHLDHKRRRKPYRLPVTV